MFLYCFLTHLRGHAHACACARTCRIYTCEQCAYLYTLMCTYACTCAPMHARLHAHVHLCMHCAHAPVHPSPGHLFCKYTSYSAYFEVWICSCRSFSGMTLRTMKRRSNNPNSQARSDKAPEPVYHYNYTFFFSELRYVIAIT